MLNRLVTPLYAVILVMVFTFNAAAQNEFVQYVPDGDTLVLKGGEVVRLMGIDSPEMGKNGYPNGYYATEARDLLASLVSETAISVSTESGLKDRYGRTIATVYLSDGTNVNELLVLKGAAMAYYHPDVPRRVYHRMIELQHSAITFQNGMWVELAKRLEQPGPFRGNRKSKRVFSAQCEGYDLIAKANRVVFNTIFDAFENGYIPARHCKVWPDQ